MRVRLSVLWTTLFVAASLAALAGCSADEPTASTTPAEVAATGSLVPTFAQVSGAVALDQADGAVVKTALNRWRESVGAGEPGTGPACGERAHPMADFLAAVAPSLDDQQLAALVAFLARHREARMDQVRDGARHERGEAMHERLAQSLGLTADQIRAMDRLRDQLRTQLRDLRAQLAAGTITSDEFETRADALREEHRARLRAMLTAEQFAKLEQMQAQHQAQMWTRRAECIDAVMARRAEWMIAALALSDEQGAQVRTTLGACADDAEALLRAAAAGDLDRDQLRTQLRDRRHDCDASLQGILSTGQWDRLTILRRLHAGAGAHGPGGPDDL